MAEQDKSGDAKVGRKAAASKTLRANPFTAYRDPKTGQWIVVKRIA
jgi:hypothetical protein